MKILGTLWMLDICVVHSLTPIIEIDTVEQIIIVRNSPGPAIPKVKYCCTPYLLNKFFLTRILSKVLLMIYLIIKEKPNVVISYYMKASGLIALLSAKIFRLPVNFNVMSGSEEYQLLRIGNKDYRSKLMEKVLLNLTKHFDSVTTTGTKTKEYLIQNGVGKDIIEILPDSVDLDRFHPEPAEKKYDLVTVARFDPAKRLENFLQIVANVKAKKSNIKVVLVGDGPLRSRLENLSRELDIEDNIDFVGYKDNVEYYYNSSRIFVLTSEREGFPMVVLEAMGCGLPCVISNVGDVPDLAVDGYNAIVIDDYDDIERYVEGILKLLNDENLYNKISGNAYKTVREKYSYENAINVWKKILKKLAVS